jgi:chromate transporter
LRRNRKDSSKQDRPEHRSPAWPLFTFAAYLGAVMEPGPNGITGALICLIAIFLPSAFLVVGLLPFRDALHARPGARAALDGTSAAVVGLLAAAFYDPVITTGIAGAGTLALALAGYGALAGLGLPSWLVVAMSALGGAALPSLGLA